ncbi:MAG: type III-A CRISPR-associated protein Csm2 [Planctomycetes bacterium]|nr:type III-A CRISPR-associated protein Csm2 [Planctomycetota bacterium]
MTDAEIPAAAGSSSETAPPTAPPSAPEAPAAPAESAAPPAPLEEGARPAPAEAAEAPPEARGVDEARPGEGRDEEGDRRRKKRRHKKGPETRPAPAPVSSGRQLVEDQIDRDADHLAREARYIPTSRLRPLGVVSQEIRRMAASGDPRDAREVRRALVLMKSKMAYLAGREQGRERGAFIKVREMVSRGIDTVLRNRETPDPAQLRNFLDHVEAFIGYHRFHTDERRRD